uniref:Uncharacterized protein n=1 Tax=Trichobilharzia regenti TaxID=157069 RepID=A0AA85JA85_TRIRE|nr:unnamed protein product [Trichobilharzia regenti]
MNRRILFNKSFSYNFITKSNKFCCARFTCCHLLVLTANKCFYNSKAENFERLMRIIKQCGNSCKYSDSNAFRC